MNVCTRGRFTIKSFHPLCSHHPWLAALGVCLVVSVAHAQLPVTNGMTFHVRSDTGVLTVNGNEVVSWLDQSGNGVNVTNTTAAERPLLIPAVLNGQPVVRFDGTTDLLNNLVTPMSGLISASQYTVFAIFQANGISQTGGAVFNQDTPVGDTAGYFSVAVESNLTSSAKSLSLYNWDGNADVASIGGYDTGSFRVFTGWHTNSTIFASTFVGLNSSAASGNTAFLGGFLQLGRGWSAGGPNFFDGDIAEIVIYNRALSDEERSLVANRLADNYGLTVPEPSAAVLVVGAALLWRRRSR